MEKRQLRKQILGLRENLSDEERMRGEILVTEKVLGHQWYYSAEHLLLFINYGSEISTGMILEEAWRQGKKVYVPKVEGKELCFYQIMDRNCLQKGYRGIPEPVGDTPVFTGHVEMAASTLMIMPGVAFDRFRNRMGYGGGFYDRYLQDKPWMHTIAIGYKCQLVEELPADGWDVKPGQVICL